MSSAVSTPLQGMQPPMAMAREGLFGTLPLLFPALPAMEQGREIGEANMEGISITNTCPVGTNVAASCNKRVKIILRLCLFIYFK